MTLNSATYFDEKSSEGGLPLAADIKGAVMRLAGAGNGIPRRRLRGDRNQCPTCHEYFNSTKAFEQHRTGRFSGTRRCLTVSEMLDKDFHKTTDDFWLCPVLAKDRERLSRIRAVNNKGGGYV